MAIVGTTTGRGTSLRRNFGRPSRRITLLGVSVLLFAASAAVTVASCTAMSMGGMPMPGGWTLSMAWLRMDGQSWSGAAVRFLGMWIAMMVAMMLPSVLPVLWRCHQALGDTGVARPGWLTASVAAGYFSVWAACGMVVFPPGAALAALAMRLPSLAGAVPVLGGVVVLAAGALQFSRWKARHLACCRGAPGFAALPLSARRAWRRGLRLGLHCNLCCAGLTASLLVVGVMDLRATGAVFAAITIERLAPAGERMARVVGMVLVGAGAIMLARVVGPW
jgi:predicted metal-binding membrane protein